MLTFSYLTAILALSPLALAADLAPALQWVTVAGDSGPTIVSASAADAQGNLYITGTTRVTDLTSNAAAPQRTSPDAYLMKLAPNGSIVYTTYFGGAGNDSPTAIAIGPGGSVYVAGGSGSADLPVSPDAYLATAPSGNSGAGFVLKLSASGAQEWATYFQEGRIFSIALDPSGSVYLGGTTSGGGILPTTPGAYNSTFRQTFTSNGFFGVPGPLSAFVTKLNPSGTALVYSTYVPVDNNGLIVQDARALAIDATGNAWIGVGSGNTLATGSFIRPSVVELNATGTAVIASAGSVSLGSVAALAFDAESNIYVAGTYNASSGFPATPGAFQSFSQPLVPTLQYQPPPGGGSDAFVAKWDHGLTRLLAATLLGGEGTDRANSVAVDASGNVIVGGFTDSRAFPTRAPFQTSFSTRAGFAAALDANLSRLVFSTFLGDSRPFSAAAVVPDGSGNLLVAGTVMRPGFSFNIADNGAAFDQGSFIAANKIVLRPFTGPRLDSVQHYVSRIALPIAPGEPIIVTGDGFNPPTSGFVSAPHIVVDGVELSNVAWERTFIAAVVPEGVATSGVHTIQVSNNGLLSNPVYVPAAIASPAIYGADGFSPNGQGLILNADGSQNTPANPSAPGSPITIYVAGAGPFTRVGPYAVTSLLPAVFINGFYCNGIAATMEPVPGLPGDVFKLSVTIPSYADLVRLNPDLKNFSYPPQSAIQLFMGTREAGLSSQAGVFINIRP